MTADGVRQFCASHPGYTGQLFVAGPEVEGVHRAVPAGPHAGEEGLDIRGLTEIVSPAYDVMDPNGVEADGTLPALPWGDDATYTAFSWFGTLTA